MLVLILSKGVADIIRSLGWTAVVAIGTNDPYGKNNLQELKFRLEKSKICVHEIPHTKISKDNLLPNLSENFKNIGIVWIGQPGKFKDVFDLINREWIFNYKYNVTWIVTETYVNSIKHSLVRFEKENHIILTTELDRVVRFDELNKESNKFFKKSPSCDQNNLWLSEYHHQCHKENNCREEKKGNLFSPAPKYLTSLLDSFFLYMQSLQTSLENCSCSDEYLQSRENCSCLNDIEQLRRNIMENLNGTYLNYSDPKWNDIVPEEYKIRKPKRISVSRNNYSTEDHIKYNVRANFLDGNELIGDIKSNGFTLYTNISKKIPRLDSKPDCKYLNICSECENKFKNSMKVGYLNFSNKGNSYLLLAFLPISKRLNNKTVTLNCSAELRKSSAGYELFEALRYGAELVKKIENVSLQIVVYDDCYNPLRPASIMSSILEKNIPVISLSGKTTSVCLEEIKGIIGTESSDVTRVIAQFSEQLKIPLISFGATASLFDNKNIFNLVLRTVPSDAIQARVMLEIAKKLSWNCAFILHTDNLYGKGGAAKLDELAKEYGIKIKAVESLPSENSPSNDNDIRSKANLIYKNFSNMGEVKAIFYFGDNEPIKLFVKELPASYQFIASEAWGDSLNVVERKEDYVNGTITIGIEPPATEFVNMYKENFTRFLWKINKHYTKRKNPWYDNFFEMKNKCYLPGSFNRRNGKERECNVEKLRESEYSSEKLHGIQFCYHVLVLVYAYGKSIANITKSKNEKNKLTISFDILKNIELNGKKIFTENGNAKPSYTIRRYIKGKYKMLGSYKEKLDLFNLRSFSSKSDLGANNCKIPPPPPPPTPHLTIIIVISSLLFVSIVITIVVFIGFLKRGYCCFQYWNSSQQNIIIRDNVFRLGSGNSGNVPVCRNSENITAESEYSSIDKSNGVEESRINEPTENEPGEFLEPNIVNTTNNGFSDNPSVSHIEIEKTSIEEPKKDSSEFLDNFRSMLEGPKNCSDCEELKFECADFISDTEYYRF